MARTCRVISLWILSETAPGSGRLRTTSTHGIRERRSECDDCRISPHTTFSFGLKLSFFAALFSICASFAPPAPRGTLTVPKNTEHTNNNNDDDDNCRRRRRTLHRKSSGFVCVVIAFRASFAGATEAPVPRWPFRPPAHV